MSRPPSGRGHGHAHTSGWASAALSLGALGVVYGDIGTSPLYTVQLIFSGDHPMGPSALHVYGAISLIFWALMLIVTLKYVLLILRADNHGEGGIMALVALIQRSVKSHRKTAFVMVGILGASLFYGDGMLTPAISVVSAVSGLQVASPTLAAQVVPLSLGILIALFLVQRFGTGAVGGLFGPIMVLWFVVIGAMGLKEVLAHPGIVRALSPTYAGTFLADDPKLGFLALGSVFLAVTGAEAIYADMGHFGRKAITHAWLALALPCLVLNYLGQGALILAHPGAITNPFFLLVPGGQTGQKLMVVLATVATVIASQAVISGAFSVTQQAMQLGFLPRMSIRHTSRKIKGQIYIPAVNWFLLAAVLVLGAHLPLAHRAGQCLRHRAERDLCLQHVPGVRGLPKDLAQAAVAGDPGRGLLHHRRADVLRREPAEGGERWLAAAGGRRGVLRDPHHLAPRSDADGLPAG